MGQGYRTAPLDTERMPPGIPYIVANEAAERFSFYGMKAILVIFMTQHLLGHDGLPSPMTGPQAKVYFHYFVSAVYFLPLAGALLADTIFGKYRTIIALSVVYCLGHFALALDETTTGLFLGLGLIAVGAGGIKPCVSAHVGDQFGSRNQHLLERVFGWFYFSINLGAFGSQLLTPWLLENEGPWAAFGLPGVLMVIATLAFWVGRGAFAHVPPRGSAPLRELVSREGLAVVARLSVIYVFVAMFWALFDQTGSSWVLQAERLDRHFLGIEWLPSQIQAANPLLVMLLIPTFSYLVYPAIDRVFPLTPLRKIGLGFFVTVLSFLVPAFIEHRLAAGQSVSIAWQILAYLILTSAEVMVSITCLEFSYTQAPNSMKSMVMSLFLVSVTLGNLFTAVVNHLIQNADGSSRLSGEDYYLFFAGAMFLTAIAFIFVARNYRGQSHVQG